jgi:outer membrane immunogenic protein
LRWYGGNEYKFDTTGSVRTRIGYALDHALLYEAAGWTGARDRVNTQSATTAPLS